MRTYLLLSPISYYFYYWISGLYKLRDSIFFPPKEGRIKRGKRALKVMQSPESPLKFLNWLKSWAAEGSEGRQGLVVGGARGVPEKDERVGRMAPVILCSQSAL